MGEIRNLANSIYQDGPIGSPSEPMKSDIRVLNGVIEDAITGAADGSVQAETWTALAAITGARVGQPATVPDSDTGTHVDPVAGGTVLNAGQYRWSDSPAGWRWVAASDTLAQQTTDNLNNLVGNTSIEDLIGGSYIAFADGLPVVSSGWNCSDFIPVFSTSRVVRTGTLIGTSGVVAGIAFYDANKSFLGATRSGTKAEDVLVNDLFSTAAFIRVSNAVADASNFSLDVLQFVRSDAVAGSERNWFSEPGVSSGFISPDGVFTATPSWLTTGFVSCQVGQTFRLTGVGNVSLVSSVSLWDKDGAFLENLGSFATNDNRKFTIDNADARYVKASATAASNPTFRGAAAQDYSTVSAFVPDVAYALKGDPLYMYARGIVPDRSVPVAWNISKANDEVLKITPPSSATIQTKLRATLPNGVPTLVGTFNVLVTDTPQSPSNHRNVICLGDSTTNGVSNANVQGAYPNELSRRLTGTGAALMTGAQNPAALSLTNIHFRGTRGDQPIKHEGRPGWNADDYLTVASKSDPVETTIANAFWDGSKFNMEYYITQNGFDIGSTADGVNATGSNLTVVIWLGWNDIYSITPSASAAILAELIDSIKTSYPDVDICVMGLNPAPEVNIKDFTGERYVSDVEVFNLAVKQLGQAYRAMCKSKTNCEFLQLSHVFNAEVAYVATTVELGRRTAETITGATDHVHSDKPGYAMAADCVYYWFLYKYCRGV